MYDAGYVELCNQIDQHCLDVDDLPPQVVLEMNERFCKAVDPTTHNGYPYQCRACAAYMYPVTSVMFDLYIHFYA